MNSCVLFKATGKKEIPRVLQAPQLVVHAMLTWLQAITSKDNCTDVLDRFSLRLDSSGIRVWQAPRWRIEYDIVAQMHRDCQLVKSRRALAFKRAFRDRREVDTAKSTKVTACM
mgnify:CR=1 FL=1